MMAKGSVEKVPALSVRRTVRAPRQRVFRAWTEAADLSRWFCPGDQFDIRVAELDLRPGGRYRFEMTAKSGEVLRLSGVYREIRPPERLAYTWRWESWGKEPEDSLVTVEFLERGAETEIQLTHELLPSAEQRRRHGEGWNGCIDHLSRYLAQAGS
jgi:uncharacterized protein YndB with AHSA1/START domain